MVITFEGNNTFRTFVGTNVHYNPPQTTAKSANLQQESPETDGLNQPLSSAKTERLSSSDYKLPSPLVPVISKQRSDAEKLIKAMEVETKSLSEMIRGIKSHEDQRDISDKAFDMLNGVFQKSVSEINDSRIKVMENRIAELKPTIQAARQFVTEGNSLERAGDYPRALATFAKIPPSPNPEDTKKQLAQLDDELVKTLSGDPYDATRVAAGITIGVLSLPVLAEAGVGTAMAAGGAFLLSEIYSTISNLATATSDQFISNTPMPEAQAKATAKNYSDVSTNAINVLSTAVGIAHGARFISASLPKITKAAPQLMNGASAGGMSALTASTLHTTDQITKEAQEFAKAVEGIPLTPDATLRLFGEHLSQKGMNISHIMTNLGRDTLLGVLGGSMGGAMAIPYTSNMPLRFKVFATLGDAATITALTAAQGQLSASDIPRIAISTLAGYMANSQAAKSVGQTGSVRIPIANKVAPQDFPDPSEYQLMLNRTQAQQVGVDETVAQRFVSPKTMDPVTGFFGPEDKMPTAQRALQFSQQTGIPVSWIDVDIANLGGLTTLLGRTKADEVYRKISQTMQKDLQNYVASKGGKLIPFRYGGDEFGFLAVGVTADEITPIVQANQIKTRQLVKNFQDSSGENHQLDNLENLKHPGDTQRAGVGIRPAVHPLDTSAETTMRNAAQEVERTKEQPLYSDITPDQIRPIPDELINTPPAAPEWQRVYNSWKAQNSYTQQLPKKTGSDSIFHTQEQIHNSRNLQLAREAHLSKAQAKALIQPFERDPVTGYNPQRIHSDALYEGIRVASAQTAAGRSPTIYHTMIDMHNFAALNKVFGSTEANKHFRTFADKYRELVLAKDKSADFSRGQAVRLEILTSKLSLNDLNSINSTFTKWFHDYCNTHQLHTLPYEKDLTNPSLQGLQAWISTAEVTPKSSAPQIYYQHDLAFYNRKHSTNDSHP